jgi:hypothetical protein
MKSLLVNLVIFMSALLTLKTVLLLTLLGSSSSFEGGEEQVCSDDTTSPNYCHPPPSWDIQKEEHPCNIEIMSADDYQMQFPNGIPVFYDEPLILRHAERNALFQRLSQRDKVVHLFPEDTVQLPNANLYSFATHNVSIEDYLNLPETSSWDDAGRNLYMLTRIRDFNDYSPPPTQASVADSRLGIGALGSGAQWHSHGPGFCEALWGRKHWALSMDRMDYDRKRPSRHWFEYQYTNYTTSTSSTRSKLWECTIHPGDAIYFPNKIWHTTVNLDPYTAFVSQFYDIAGLK